MQVKLPNGKIGNFPDSMSKNEINEAIKRNFGESFNTKYITPTSALQLGGQLTAENPTARGAALGSLSYVFPPIAPFTSEGLLPLAGNLAANVLKGGMVGASATPLTYSYDQLLNKIPNGRALGERPDFPQNIGQEALYNAATSGLGELGFGIAPFINKFRPGKLAKQIVGNLGENISENKNLKNMANHIEEVGKKEIEIGGNKFNDITKAAGNERIHNEILPEGKEYISLPEIAEKYKTKNVDILLRDFNKNPTLENAMKLQSQLRKNGSKLISGEGAEQIAAHGFFDARNQLLDSMEKFLKSKDPRLANDLKEARYYWRENVVPFTEHPVFSNIVEGLDKQKTGLNLRNLINLFKREGGYENVVANKLGKEHEKRMLISQIGTKEARENPQKLVEAVNNMQKSGLERYTNPELLENVSMLENMIKNKKSLDYYKRNLKYLAGGLGAAFGGASLANHYGNEEE